MYFWLTELWSIVNCEIGKIAIFAHFGVKVRSDSVIYPGRFDCFEMNRPYFIVYFDVMTFKKLVTLFVTKNPKFQMDFLSIPFT